jgi:hypothetical protein
MAMNKREKMLAAVTGGLLVVVGVVAFVMLGEPRNAADLRKDIEEKSQELAKVDAEIRKCETAAADVGRWKARSLPWDTVAAQKVYGEWLRQACSRIHFDKNTDPGTPRPIFTADKDKKDGGRKEVARVIPYKITNEATLDQLTQFLYEFYSAGYLHKITSLDIAPAATEEKSGKVSKENLKLTVKIEIEALALKDGPAGDVSKLKPERPPLATLEAYRKDPQGIVQRNLFAVYEPPKPPKPPEVVRVPPKPPKRDPPPEYNHVLENARVTGIVQVDGRAQVWLSFPTVNEVPLQLSEGDVFDVKSVRGKILQINSRDVIVDVGGKRLRVDLNRTLFQGVPLRP